MADVNSTNCLNSTDIGFNTVYTVAGTTTSDAARNFVAILPLVMAVMWVVM